MMEHVEISSVPMSYLLPLHSISVGMLPCDGASSWFVLDGVDVAWQSQLLHDASLDGVDLDGVDLDGLAMATDLCIVGKTKRGYREANSDLISSMA